jgi:hypothetical protein
MLKLFILCNGIDISYKSLVSKTCTIYELKKLFVKYYIFGKIIL